MIVSCNFVISRSLTQESIVLGETNPGGISDVAQFAPPSSIFNAIFSITNLGSTRVPFAQLSIFWPLDAPVDCDDRSTDEDCRFYLYPIQTDDGVRHMQWITTVHSNVFLLSQKIASVVCVHESIALFVTLVAEL